ncbi:SpoIID/LytB domain-containing protein [Cellulomonas sp.]|uniref:SpoIID/LytB domain-containing protein n=1 Tax=Cellulomonas sp. TaxID=40001 RepID=UPI003BAB22D2
MQATQVRNPRRGGSRWLAAVVALVAAAATLTSAASGAAAAADDVTITGHGWGHGRGMGQYGALGYALQGASYADIVRHYYGGTTLASDAGNPEITVELSALTGKDTILTGPGLWVNGESTGTGAVLVRADGVGGLNLYTAASCAGPAWTLWKNLGSGLTVGSSADTTQQSQQTRVCEATGSRGYRGVFRVVLAGGVQYTWNQVTAEDYLRGVVPREMPSSWSTQGAGKGIEALKAQAVAARGYALSGSKSSSGAITCDTTACQVYGGSATWSADGSQVTSLEAASSDTAVAATRSQVMRTSGGAIARTEFSSSTGGYTAGGVFPAVVDDGDAIGGNANHNWSTTLSRASVTSALGVGAIASIQVTGRNGLGADGGRVTQVTVTNMAGTVSTFTGNAFRSRLGLKSDWFSVTVTAPVDYCSGSGGAGYWMAASDGGVFAFCGAGYYGSAGGLRLTSPVVAMASTASGQGYWLVASDGGVFSYGDAAFFGSTGAIKLNKPIVDILPTATGNGYWLIATDGGVFAFGDAAFRGSTGAIRLNKPIVTSQRTPSGNGYWLIASDGGVFAFGDAGFFGSTGAIRLNQPIVAAVAPAVGGYGLVASDGGYFAFPPAQFYGSTGAIKLNKPIVTASLTRSGAGYWMFASDGGVFAFGDAPFLGSLGALKLNAPIVDAAAPSR